MLYDKVNGDVGFLEGPHRYENLKDPSIQYTSVTTMIEKYGKPFDKEFTSKYKALERLLPTEIWKKEKGSIWKNHKIPKNFLEVYDISEEDLNRVQQDILDEWQSINKESCERGTEIHAQLENSFYKAGKNITLQKFGIGGKFECRKGYNELNLEYGVYPEYLIYYDNPKINLHIAGQIDLLVKNGNDISIIDHKGLPLDTPILTSNGWSTMGDLKVGDKVFDKEGNLCNITVKSDVHHNPCYKITFNTGENIVADMEHRWLISIEDKSLVMTTLEIKECLNKFPRIMSAKNIPDSKIKSPDFRIIKSVEEVETVPTQCISVDSPSHTYLCTHSLIVTHNTNRKIDTKGFYNSGTRTSDKMLYPLRNLDECNYNHYQLQLSTYAWMLQKINPEFVIKDLILNHYDHEGKNTLYHCSYLKDEVERMLKHFTKKQQLEKQKSKYARIEY